MSANINLPWAAAISEGMKQGIDRHWRYSKEMLKVKPEYLLTVFVAERLAWGAGEQSGYDLSIKLEESTHNIVGRIWFNQIGHKGYFRENFSWPGRRGRVDIYVEHELTKEARIIELKNFDPSSTELSKELKRFINFFGINDYSNHLRGCYLAFPTLDDRKSWIQELANKWGNDQLKITVNTRHSLTGTDPEDGIPEYWLNVVSYENLIHEHRLQTKFSH